MGSIILAAILWLAPHVGETTVARYAGYIEREAKRWEVDPLLVVAVIEHETGGTWNPAARSRTNDWGLMQLHVSRTTRAGYLRRPERLLVPRLNIRLGVRALALWRRRHAAHCPTGPHAWWSHYNQGVRVRDGGAYGRRVGRIFERLQTRFGPGEV
jgi:hypothetical protein